MKLFSYISFYYWMYLVGRPVVFLLSHVFGNRSRRRNRLTDFRLDCRVPEGLHDRLLQPNLLTEEFDISEHSTKHEFKFNLTKLKSN
jgi:hypothetical protein